MVPHTPKYISAHVGTAEAPGFLGLSAPVCQIPSQRAECAADLQGSEVCLQAQLGPEAPTWRNGRTRVSSALGQWVVLTDLASVGAAPPGPNGPQRGTDPKRHHNLICKRKN